MERKDDKQEETKRTISRRNFLKSTGVAGLAVGTVAAGSMAKPKSVFAGEDTGRALLNLTIKEVDEPPYMSYPYEGAENIERFDEGLTSFNHPESVAGFMKAMKANPEGAKITNLKSKDPIPGYSLVDYALNEGSSVTDKGEMHKLLYSWDPIGSADLKKFDVIEKWNGTPEENNKIIKKAAKFYGAGQTGVTQVNEKWFYSKSCRDSLKGIPYIFSDQHDKTLVTDEAIYIPKSYKTLIVMVIPMDEDLMAYSPSVLSACAPGEGYDKMAETSGKLAEFIRGLGYNAMPLGNGGGATAPMAIDAGLGELGRHGLLINPVYGSWIRTFKVLTDLPSTYDKPINFGAAEFCVTCMKCAESCPTKSISFDKEPSYEIACGSNNPGMKKWYIMGWNCIEFWASQGFAPCSNCAAVCPYNKPQTWIHDLVKAVSAKTPIFNSTFKKLDDTLGYGDTLDNSNPGDFWDNK